MNRSQRRSMMQKLGMFKTKTPYVALAVPGDKTTKIYPWNEKVRRAQAAGQNLRMQFLSYVETSLNNAAVEKQAKIIANLVEAGFTEAQAEERINKNFEIENARFEKKLARDIARNNVNSTATL